MKRAFSKNLLLYSIIWQTFTSDFWSKTCLLTNNYAGAYMTWITLNNPETLFSYLMKYSFKLIYIQYRKYIHRWRQMIKFYWPTYGR